MVNGIYLKRILIQFLPATSDRSQLPITPALGRSMPLVFQGTCTHVHIPTQRHKTKIMSLKKNDKAGQTFATDKQTTDQYAVYIKKIHRSLRPGSVERQLSKVSV